MTVSKLTNAKNNAHYVLLPLNRRESLRTIKASDADQLLFNLSQATDHQSEEFEFVIHFARWFIASFKFNLQLTIKTNNLI